jgi:hypothetical protein
MKVSSPTRLDTVDWLTSNVHLDYDNHIINHAELKINEAGQVHL